MTTKHQELVIEEFTTPEQVEAALEELTNRCYALPMPKQAFLATTIKKNPDLDVEVIALIVLMLENSDDDFNITSPELNELIAQATEAHETQEHTK
jgi:hypothetical protein